MRPSYATNIETLRANGRVISYVDLDFDQGDALDLAQVGAAVRSITRHVPVTTPHNPTGFDIPEPRVQALVEPTRKHEFMLLADGTCREMCFADFLPAVASYGDHVISVSSLSKDTWNSRHTNGLACLKEPRPHGAVSGHQGTVRHFRQRDRRNDCRCRAGTAQIVTARKRVVYRYGLCRRQGSDRKRAADRLGRTCRQLRLFPPHHRRGRNRHRCVPQRFVRTMRHLWRSRTLVQPVRYAFPDRIRPADAGGIAQGSEDISATLRDPAIAAQSAVIAEIAE